jgi:hypothetical protein
LIQKTTHNKSFMHCQYLKKLCSLLLFLPFAVNAQDITGLWKGTLYNDTTKLTLRYEIGISQQKGKLSGFSHTFFIIDDQQYFGLKKLKIKKRGTKIIIEDDGLIANNYPVKPPKGVHQVSALELDIRDSIMVLSGPFATTRTRDYHPLTGSVYLQRKNDFRQSALVPHLTELGLANENSFLPAADIAIAEPELAKPAGAAASTVEPASSKALPKTIAANNKQPVTIGKAVSVEEPEEPALAKMNGTTVTVTPSGKKPAGKPQTIAGSSVNPVTLNRPVITYEPAAEVNDRKLEMVETVFFKSDSLQLTLYDNGEVDGDTVSVLINGKVVMPKQGLSTKAIRKTIFLPPGTDSLQLIMYAENLGSIPPNTGLLVVQDGDVVYEIRFSADMGKNSAIVFRRKRQ